MSKPGKKVSLAVWSLVLAVFTLVAFHVPFFLEPVIAYRITGISFSPRETASSLNPFLALSSWA